MPVPPVAALSSPPSLLRRLLAWAGWGGRDSRRGSIAVIVAVSFIPLTVAGGVAVDMSRMADARSALQRATDNAALSGAAAYVVYTQQDSFNAVARTMAHSAFCNAVTALPAGFALVSTSGSTACGSGQGPAVSAVIAGYQTGTRGIMAGSGCTATNTVVSGVVCGFIVTVSTSATVKSVFPFISGGNLAVSVTSSAINPFINLAKAITPNFAGSAANANSLWIYPLLLDSNGAPDFSTNYGALPDASACTGNPTQSSCGSYTMLASTLFFSNCPASNPCNVNGTIFIDGVVQNPVVGTAVITATTPLGVAFQSAAGAGVGSGAGATPYYPTITPNPKIADTGCSWPWNAVYNTVAQSMDANGYPLVVDANGNWPLVTHWFYSSFLANSYPPDYNELALQANSNINPSTGYSYATQIIPAVLTNNSGNGKDFNYKASQVLPVDCPNAYSTPKVPGTPAGTPNAERMATTYPATGATNCSLYIVKDPGSLSAVGSYSGSNTCFTPANTPGYQYSALSCQNYAGHNYAFYWNDMGGRIRDDTNYNNGNLQIACTGASYVLLIN